MASRGSGEMSEAEEIRLGIETELINLTVEGLYQVAQEAGIRQGRYRNRNRLTVLREIRTYLDNVEQDEIVRLDRLRYILAYVRALLEEPQYWEQTPPGRQSRRSPRDVGLGDGIGGGGDRRLVTGGHPSGTGHPNVGNNGFLSDSHESDNRSVVSDGGDSLASGAHASGVRSVRSGVMGSGGRGIGRAMGILGGPLRTSLSGVGRGTGVGGPVGRGFGRGIAGNALSNTPNIATGRGISLRQPVVQPRQPNHTTTLTPVARQQASNRHLVSRSSAGSGTGHDSQSSSSSSDDSPDDTQSDATSRASSVQSVRKSKRSVPLRTHRRSSYVLPKVSGGSRRSTVTVSDLKDAWRREFKLKGQIGKIGDKDKLDFLSVKRQIDRAIKKGYDDVDIIEAVINATSSGSSLKGLLQVLPNLTVKEMMKVLRSYFQEFDGSDLLLQLTTAVQSPKDDALTFLIDVLFLKNRIIEEGKRSKEAKFGKSSVKKIMLKTLESGIASDRIVNRMRPFLLKKKVTDTELISEMSKALRYEKDRKAKSKQHTRVNAIETSDDFLVEDPRDIRIANLEAQLKELKVKEKCCKEDEKDQKIAKLEAQIREMRAGDKDAPKKKKGRIYGCKDCKSKGQGRSCSHCFVCGDPSHKVEKCPQKNEQVSNSNRSSGGD